MKLSSLNRWEKISGQSQLNVFNTVYKHWHPITRPLEQNAYVHVYVCVCINWVFINEVGAVWISSVSVTGVEQMSMWAPTRQTTSFSSHVAGVLFSTFTQKKQQTLYTWFGSILCCHCKREPDLGYRRRALFNAIFLAISPTTLCLWNLHTFKNILCFHIKPWILFSMKTNNLLSHRAANK